MMGKHHMMFAASGWVAGYSTGVVPRATVGGVIPGLVVATAAGLLPDIDEDGSIVARSLGPVGQLLSHVIATVSGGHRGATHTVPAALLFSLAVWLLTRDPSLAVAALWGYLSHLVGDTLTPMGVPWGWPLDDLDERFSVGLFTTGTFIEVLVVHGGAVLCGVVAIRFSR